MYSIHSEFPTNEGLNSPPPGEKWSFEPTLGSKRSGGSRNFIISWLLFVKFQYLLFGLFLNFPHSIFIFWLLQFPSLELKVIDFNQKLIYSIMVFRTQTSNHKDFSQKIISQVTVTIHNTLLKITSQKLKNKKCFYVGFYFQILNDTNK